MSNLFTFIPSSILSKVEDFLNTNHFINNHFEVMTIEVDEFIQEIKMEKDLKVLDTYLAQLEEKHYQVN